jgi:hypothetical protein
MLPVAGAVSAAVDNEAEQIRESGWAGGLEWQRDREKARCDCRDLEDGSHLDRWEDTGVVGEADIGSDNHRIAVAVGVEGRNQPGHRVFVPSISGN